MRNNVAETNSALGMEILNFFVPWLRSTATDSEGYSVGKFVNCSVLISVPCNQIKEDGLSKEADPP